MTELLLALLLITALLAAGAVALVPWDLLVDAGVWLAAAGLVVGAPTGLVYHIRLRDALAPRGALPPRWFWNPIALHHLLTRSERRTVLPWCYAGAAGFGLNVLGALLLIAAIVSAWLELRRA